MAHGYHIRHFFASVNTTLSVSANLVNTFFARYTPAMQIAIPDLALPLRLRTEHPLTDEQLMRFCTANEILRVERESNGELLLMSPAGNQTSSRNAWLIFQLTRWAEEDGRGLTFDSNGGFTLPDTSMRSPDAAWTAWSRWHALSLQEKQRFAPLCPEFIIELRSPSDSLSDARGKMRMWIANGTELAWLIDPERRVVEVYRPGQEPEVTEGASSVIGEGPVTGFVLELARLWA